ncbi:RHS repeat-associated core domain-containing protein [Streptomyces sp. NPDC007355]|uniref:RHS repeat-associated core domain-containing protein n=1 Tax=Streptomyces sp. NPDC007355 TaxID=3364778 RepID=UPI003699BB54
MPSPRQWRQWIAGVTTTALLSSSLSIIGINVASADELTSVPQKPTGKNLEIPTTPVIKATGAGGYLPGTSQVNPDGSLSYSIPLKVPAGRAGMSPSVSLEYSSGNRNGVVGAGWSISGASAITRCPKDLAVEGTVLGIAYGATDRFCLDGAKLVSTSGTYGGDLAEYRTENDAFAKVMSAGGSTSAGPDKFTVFLKNGRVRTYLAQTAVRSVSGVSLNPLSTGNVQTSTPRVMWLLDSEADRTGNEIRYGYAKTQAASGNEFLLSEITYTWANSVGSTRSVVFNYQTRPDEDFSFVNGVKYVTSKRLASISMKAPNPATTSVVWEYRLGYEVSGSGRSLLNSVKQCSTATGGSCTQAKQFGWTATTLTPSFTAASLPGGTGSDVVDDTQSVKSFVHVLDADGDGADDLLYTLGGSSGSADFFVRRGYRGSNGVMSPLQLKELQTVPLGWPAGTSLRDSRPADTNGDGKTDMWLAHTNSSSQLVTDEYRYDTDDKTFKATGQSLGTNITDLVDVNGDGLIDAVQRNASVTSGSTYAVRINTAGTLGSSMSASQASVPTGSCPSPQARDVNGDGRGELLVVRPNSVGGCNTNLPDANAVGVDENGNVSVLSGVTTVSGTDYYRFGLFSAIRGDFNGDGLEDFLRLNPASSGAPLTATIVWNTGAGLVVGPTISRTTDATPQAVDMNGDGRDDLLYTGTKTMVDYSTGTGGFTHDDITTLNAAMNAVGDFDADGDLDIMRVSLSTMSLLTQNNQTVDRLATVKDENTAWNREAFSYSTTWSTHPENLASHTAGSCSYPLSCPRRGMTVVRKAASKAHLKNADGSSVDSFYSYEDPVTDRRGRGFLGFGTFRVWQPNRPSEATTVFDVRAKIGTAYAQASLPAQVTTTTPMLTLAQAQSHPTTAKARITRTSKTYETRSLNSGKTWAVLNTTGITKTWEQDITLDANWTDSPTGAEHLTGENFAATPLRTETNKNSYDNLGNLTDEDTTSSSGDNTTITTTFDNRVSDWLISLPQTTTATNTTADYETGAPTTRVKTTQFDSLGRLQSIFNGDSNAGAGNHSSTTLTYDTLGALVKTTVSTNSNDMPDRVSHLGYDPVFPGQPRDEVYVSQAWSEHTAPDNSDKRPSVWSAVHPAYGVTVATLDVNGVSSSATYDDLSRLVTVSPAGAATTTYSYTLRPAGSATNGVTITATTPGGGTTSASSDALGRLLATTITAFDNSTSTSTVGYDILGRQISATAPSPGGTSTAEFDALDRLIKAIDPAGESTTITPGFTQTTMVDAEGRTTKQNYDIDGHLTSVVQILQTGGSSQNTTTSYSYAPFGQLHKITDNLGHVTTATYDALGRRITLNEPDKGASTTSYYGTGEIKTDTHTASGHSTTFTYDDLGRMLTSVTEDGTSTFTYDTAAHGIGSPATALSPDGVLTTHRYDTLARHAGTDVTDPDDSHVYSTDTTYSSTTGRPDTLTYPATSTGRSRLAIQYGYTTNGYQNKISDITNPTTPRQLWHVNTRQPNLSLATATLGTSTAITHTYRTDGTARLDTAKAANSGGTTLQQFAYGYDDTGLLTSRTQTGSSVNRVEAFGYDTLQRLTSWTLSGATEPVTTTYSWDTIGNLLDTTRAGTLTEHRTYNTAEGSTKPHELVSYTANGNTTNPSYDSEGRQTNGANRASIEYTAFDLPKRITMDDGTKSGYLYDAYGQRFKKTTDDSTTIYVGAFEKRITASGTSYIHYISGTEGPIGQIVYTGSSTTDYQLSLTDQLGSTTTTLDNSEAVDQKLFYDPFGSRTTSAGLPSTTGTGNLTRGYTDHEHDTETGLINMNGRLFDPQFKTFLTPDPLRGIGGQGANPYMYVAGNPINNTDPTGLMTCVFVKGGRCADFSSPGAATGGWGAVNDGLDNPGLHGGIGDGTPGSNPGSDYNGEPVHDAAVDSFLHPVSTSDATAIEETSEWDTPNNTAQECEEAGCSDIDGMPTAEDYDPQTTPGGSGPEVLCRDTDCSPGYSSNTGNLLGDTPEAYKQFEGPNGLDAVVDVTKKNWLAQVAGLGAVMAGAGLAVVAETAATLCASNLGACDLAISLGVGAVAAPGAPTLSTGLERVGETAAATVAKDGPPPGLKEAIVALAKDGSAAKKIDQLRSDLIGVRLAAAEEIKAGVRSTRWSFTESKGVSGGNNYALFIGKERTIAVNAATGKAFIGDSGQVLGNRTSAGWGVSEGALKPIVKK